MYVEVIKSKQKEKVYQSVLIRESYRENGKVKHRTIANITKLPVVMIEEIKRIIIGKEGRIFEGRKRKVGVVEIKDSREYGGSKAIWEICKRLEIERLINRKRERWDG